MAQLIDLDAIDKPLEFDDELSDAQIANIENDSADLKDYVNGILSILRRIIHGDDPGDYKDSPVTSFAKDASLKALVGYSSELDADSILVEEISELDTEVLIEDGMIMVNA